MIALFAALIGPWFINWDDYKANFEAEAEKILGQPVRVIGSAEASILPSPSLTFTKVEVGDNEGQPMMTVERFDVTIELMPLLQGEISVISMKLDRPVVRVSVDDGGQVDWFLRSEASRDLNPDAVILSGVEIADGTLIYNDAGAGSAITLQDVRASIEARSLAGPWRIEGSYSQYGVPVQFTIGTGRRSADGSLRVKFDTTPGHWPVAISTDGVIKRSAEGPSYSGVYNATQIVVAEEGRSGDSAGWRSEGSFSLTRDRLVVDQAVLSEGPPDRPSSLAGSMTVELGEDARFEATVQARQLDLDRSLGAGPSEPIEVSAATDSFVEWLAGIPVPPIPGRIDFNVPGIVVGGNVIRDVRFLAKPEDRGWLIEGLRARLPGQATFEANGRLSTGERVGFGGVVRLAVGQPATFAAWWRGRSQDGAGRLLAPFDLSGRATVSVGGVAVEDMTTKIDDATITGGFSWAGPTADSPGRKLRTDLQADRLDFGQIRALAELLGGRDLSDATAIADSYTIRVAANDLKIEDVAMRDVTIDAAFVDGGLTVSGVEVGDIGGASFRVTRGQIDNILTEPIGRLEAQLTAGDLKGLARVVDRVAPDTPFSRWFNQAASSLSPASVSIVVDSVMEGDTPNSRFDIKGSADATNFDATVELDGVPTAWRAGSARVAASLSSYDAVGVAGQIGLDPVGDSIGGARISLSAVGVPNTGLATELQGSFGGLNFRSSGKLVLTADLPATYAGTFGVESEDLDPLIRMVGLGIPGAALGTPVRLAGTIEGLGPSATVSWANGQVGGHRVSGSVRVAERNEGGVKLDEGSLQVDTLDAGWIAALGLGFAPLPTGDPEQPWSSTAFSDPVFGRLEANFDVEAEQLTLGDSLQISGTDLSVAILPNRIDFDVKAGKTAGGSVVGGYSIRNVGGNANIVGRLSLVDASLDSLIWQRAGRAVATGTLDLSADFEATGRSPAGLISSLTGGGTLAIHEGEARYVNPRAANLVIRASDRGQQFDEDQLRDLFASYIDAGSLAFAESEAPFSIAAGTIRFQNMIVNSEAASASGSAAIDLNTLQIVSDWTLTLDAGDVDDTEARPQVGIVFRGPLDQPDRVFDVLQFNSYLNIRQEERLQQILIMEEEARLENERLKRLKRKLQEDAERREREREAARLARMAAAANLEELHVAREASAEARAEAAHAVWLENATIAADRKAAAEQAAREAAEAAEAEARRAEETRAAVATAQAAVETAGDTQEEATTELEWREAILAEHKEEAAALSTAVADAATRVEAAIAAVEEATTVLAGANGDLDAAQASADAAAARTAAALEAAEAAERAAEEARDAAEEVAAEAADLEQISGARNAAAAEAAETLAAAKADAIAKAQIEAAAADKREEASDAAAELAERAANALAEADQAEADLAAARALADGARENLVLVSDAALAAERDATESKQKLGAARDSVTSAVDQLDEQRRRLAALEDQQLTVMSDGSSPEPDTEAIDKARGVVEEAEAEVAAARKRLEDLEAEIADLADAAAKSVATEGAARTAHQKATADAVALEEPARAARSIADELETEAAVAAATANAAGIAADNAAAAANEAAANVKRIEDMQQAAVAAADEADAAAGGGADAARDAQAAADAAAEAARAARAAAVAAAEDQAAAERDASDAVAAAAIAEDQLAAAERERENAVKESDLAKIRLAEAGDAVARASATVDEQVRRESQALERAKEALDALRAARAAAEAAAEAAAAAEVAARDAAARAAELPRSWLPELSPADRAAVGSDDRVVTEALLNVDETTPVLQELEPVAEEDVGAIGDADTVPEEETEAEATPVAETVEIVIPRPRPQRRETSEPAGPSPVADPAPLQLPTDARPLTISPLDN